MILFWLKFSGTNKAPPPLFYPGSVNEFDQKQDKWMEWKEFAFRSGK